MLYSGSKYSSVSRVKDRRSFNIEYLEYYSLLLQIGANDFQVCVTDTRNNACLLLEDYILEEADSFENYLNCIRQLFDDHHFLLANFWNSVTLSVKNDKFALVPNEFFSKDAAFDFLKFNAPLQPQNELYLQSSVKDVDAVAVFAVDKRLIDFINSIYTNVECKLIHQSCALIEGIICSEDLKPHRQMYIYLDRRRMHLSVMDNRKLIFYNQFNIRNFSDYIKYIALAAREFDYDIQRQAILVWGYTNSDSQPINEMNKYIGDIRFGQRPAFVKLGFEFDEIPEHQYLDVYGIYLCA